MIEANAMLRSASAIAILSAALCQTVGSAPMFDKVQDSIR
jgi:hypothetical protein